MRGNRPFYAVVGWRPCRPVHLARRLLLSAMLFALLATIPGCVGTLANLVHVAKGSKIPAKYTGLEAKRVAVVCVSNSEAFGPAEASISLARSVGQLIGANVDKVTLIDSSEIAKWIDENDWDYVDYKAVGKGVNAQMVVAIDLNGFSLHDGKTLYKGRADVRMVVYDMTENGKVAFSYSPDEIEYPENASHHTTDMPERTFRNRFLSMLAHRLARQFYSYDATDDFARDSSVIHAS
jgi:hypothetical protein